MHTFQDARGRTWAVEFTVGSLMRIKESGVADLANLTEETFQALALDNLRLGQVLELSTRIVDRNGVDDSVTLSAALAGDSLGAARQAFIDELVAFFPSRRERAAIAQLAEIVSAARSKAIDLMERRLGDGSIERMLDEAMSEAADEATPEAAEVPSGATSGTSSGASPESSVSTPGSSRSENST